MQSLYPTRIELVVEVRAIVTFSERSGLKAILVKKVYEAGALKDTISYPTKTFVRIENISGTYDFTYIYHEGQLVAQLNPDNSKYFIHGDHEGSTSVVTDSNGRMLENTTYTPHGEILSGGSVSRFDSEGKEYSSVVGDYDFNFRKMKPEWGLFTQPDTLIPSLYDPQSLNRYMFERGNPYKNVDPTGHDGGASLAVGAYVTWKVWGAFLSLVPVGQFIHDPTSVSTTQLKGAAVDAGLSLVPISGDVQTAINTLYFAADPLEYLTNPDYPVSPGTRIAGALSKEEKEKKGKERVPVTPPTKITDQAQGTMQQDQKPQEQSAVSGSSASSANNGQASALFRFWNKITTYFTKQKSTKQSR